MVTIEDVRELLAEGKTQAQVALELGVSASTISRLRADHNDDNAHRSTQDAVDVFVASLGEMAPDVAARAEGLRALARKLDWTAGANTGTAAAASAAIVKEYRSLLDELRETASFDELRAALLAPDDD